VAKKGQEEVKYFEQCVKEAARGGPAATSKSENDLFAKQGTQGINFDTYDPLCAASHKSRQPRSPLSYFLPL
jgi:hypothetical protein